MGTRNGLFRKMLMCVFAALLTAVVFTACELKDPVTESTYYINDSQANYYNKDHTTTEEAVDEFTDSITALRKYLDSESFVDTGYYMGVDFDIDILDQQNNTAGNFALRVKSYLYTYPYEDEDGNPIYKYYEDGTYYDENNPEGTRQLVSALEIHNEAIKKSDICIEWYNGATNEVLIGLYFDGLNSNSDNPGNILYLNIQGNKRSFENFGDTVIYQQLIRLLVSLSVEGLLESLGLQADAGTSSINSTMVSLVGENYKRVVNGDLISLLFYSLTLDAITQNVNEMLYDLLGVFERKWDPMTYKFLGFKFSTVANALVQTIDADMQAIISPDKNGVNNVLTNAAFQFRGVVDSYDVLYTYTSNVRFDYGWVYPDDIYLDMNYYTPFDYGNYEFKGKLYVPAWDAQFDALIRTDIQQYDNSKNNVFMEFRDIANGELMIGIYYRHERSYLDITGLSYMYGWVDLEYLGFPQVYDEHLDLADVLNKFFKMVDNVIVSIVDSILDPAKSDKENRALEYIMNKTSYTEKIPFGSDDEKKLREELTALGYSDEEIEAEVRKKLQESLFSANTETLRVDIELVKQMLEETGQGTFSTRQIINILDSLLPYTMDQIAIMLGISSAEVMIEKTYFTFTWDVDDTEFTMIMYTNVGVKVGDPSIMMFQLDLVPIHFGEYVQIADIDFSGFKPLEEIYTYSGTLKGNFIFSSQETVDLSKLLSATIGESSGLNTPYILAQNAGLTFQLIYDQFVKDQVVEGRLKKAGRSAFELTVWLTGTDAPVLRAEEQSTGSSVSTIITLCSDDVSFNNEVYKDLPAREAELGYIWVNIACVTKNGMQAIPKMKIREDIFMASMSAYMNNETSITDDVSSFADNDFNLSLTSIISALCRDAYVIAEPEQLEITSSNDTLQSLFRVNGLIGNIKVDAGFTYRVEGLESIRKQYLMYEVGFFENITGENPYNTPLHSTLPTYFYQDYMDDYKPLEYDFYVYPKDILLDDGTIIEAGTILLFELGARKTVSRQTIEYPANSFFNNEPAENNDIKRVKFQVADLPFIDYKDGLYYYNTYYNKVKTVEEKYIETGTDGTVYIYWLGIDDVLMYDEGTEYYYFDKSMYLYDEFGEYVYIEIETFRDLLFEYDPDSVKITEACKTQYAPRTNGSFMGEVRRYFVTFESNVKAELGSVIELFYDANTSVYPEYYNDEDRDYIEKIYDKDGVLISEEKKPIKLCVMEPFEALATSAKVNVATGSNTVEVNTFDAKFLINWETVTGKGYMIVTSVTIAPGMMGEKTFPVRIIVTNREIDTTDYVSVYTSEQAVFTSEVPVVDTIEIDPYDYLLKKYEYLSDIANFNPAYSFTRADLMDSYSEASRKFSYMYFSDKRFSFEIKFKYFESYLYINDVKDLYIAKKFENYYFDDDGNEIYEPFDWNFDRYEAGTNSELSISPDGGVIYLHTRFRGQLIALRVVCGKREFSHLKFGEDDTFNKTVFEAENNYEEEINGYYKSNYYDQTSYKIDTLPIFVFKDDEGAEYEYIFNMKLVSGLKEKYNGEYSSEYEYRKFELSWENEKITYVSTEGSYYEEFMYYPLYTSEKSKITVETATQLPPVNPEVWVFDKASKTWTKKKYYFIDEATNKRAYYGKMDYEELRTVLGDEFDDQDEKINYGTGVANKFIMASDGTAYIRSDAKYSQNRPFYYFVDTSSDTPDEPIYLTDEQYAKVFEPDYAGPIKFVTSITNELTTTGFKPYYLFRLYAALNGEKYAISVIDNEFIENTDGEEVKSESQTGFRTIVLRIKVECPALELIELGEVNNELTDEQKAVLPVGMRDTFVPNRILNGEDTEYLVDPLNPETLYLPDKIRIYFKEVDDSSSISYHVFDKLVWGEIIKPDGTEQLGTYVIKETYEVNGVEHTRYKLKDIDLDKQISFPVQTRIGDEYRGYTAVTVWVRVLSKDPKDVQFYTADSSEPIEVEKIDIRVDNGNEVTERTYYNYYVNTFAGFKVPERILATFGDGHQETYNVTWREAKTDSDDFIFSPNTLVALCTTIGTEGGVYVEIYLCVVVGNYALTNLNMINGYIDRYVTVQYQNGSIATDENGNLKRIQLKDMFVLDEINRTIGYYLPTTGENSEGYIRISTGAENDNEVESSKIGLYINGFSQNISATEEISPYELLLELFSQARMTLARKQFEYDNQKIGKAGGKSVYEYDLQMVNTVTGETRYFNLRDIVKTPKYTVTFNAIGNAITNERLDVSLNYIDTMNFNQEYRPIEDENGKLKIRPRGESDEYARMISYGELIVYLTQEDLAVNYSNWEIDAVKAYGESYKKFEPLNAEAPLLKNYYRYGTQTGLEILAELRSVIAPLDTDITKYGYVRLTDGTESVEMGYYELLYRLNYYIKNVRVKADEDDPNDPMIVIEKQIKINDLYSIMDISDMVYRRGMTETDGKYVVSLGANRGSYDLDVYLRFGNGYYFGENSNVGGSNSSLGSSSVINVLSYSTEGNAMYSNNYRMSTNIVAEIEPIRNDGTGQTVAMRYNYSSDEEQLTRWHIESVFGDFEIDPSLIDEDGCITIIPASSIYRLDKGEVRIELSALTSEGFRVRRTLVFENLPSTTSQYTGAATTAGGFNIADGIIHVENIYDYYRLPANPDKNSKPSILNTLGTPDLLPKSVSVVINGRKITVGNVEWVIEKSWYGNATSVLDGISYKGTTNSSGEAMLYLMASANILGYTVNESSVGQKKTYGQMKINVNIKIDSAEVLILPWEEKPYAINTETVYEEGNRIYVVYVDAFEDVKTDMITGTDTLTLPSTIKVEYDSGNTFDFSGIDFTYRGKKVSKLLFDEQGLDYYSMIQDQECLFGYTIAEFEEEYIDLDVDIGLGQVIKVRFYVYDKTVSKVTPDGGYAYVGYYRNGKRVVYSELTEEEKAQKDATNTYMKYASDENGNALIVKTEFHDIEALIELDDETIRQASLKELQSDLTVYQSELLGQVNFNRVRYNTKRIVEVAQEIKNDIPDIVARAINSVDVHVAYIREGEIKNALRSWMADFVTFDDENGTYTIDYGRGPGYSFSMDNLPETTAFSYDECYDFALTELVSAAVKAMDLCESDIITLLKGSGSDVNKTRRREELVRNYVTDFANEAYDSLIKKYLEREYVRLFSEELSNMSDKDFSNAIYYKNILEAAFDEDETVKNIYRLRSFRKTETPAWIALRQMEIDDEIKNVLFADISEMSFTEAYRTLAIATIIQAVRNAYKVADKKVMSGNADMAKLMTTVKTIFENRLNLPYYLESAVSTGKNSIYTIEKMLDIVYIESGMSKKVLRAYLVNMISEAMDFTQANVGSFFGSETKETLIKTTFSSISNYATTIKAIRKSIVNGSEIEGILNNLLIAGIRNFAENVYAEQSIVAMMRNIQKLNGTIIGADEFIGGEYDALTFISKASSTGGVYYVDPYYLYRLVPDKIIIYFEEGNSVQGNVGGFPYLYKVGTNANTIWTVDYITNKVNYKGAEESVSGSVLSDVTEKSYDISMRISVRRHIVDDAEKEITSTLIEEITAYMNSGSYALKYSSDNKYKFRRKDVTEGYNTVNYVEVFNYDDFVMNNPNQLMKFSRYNGKFKIDNLKGYDDNKYLLYEFDNKRTAGTGTIEKQSMYVYNPFEFSQSKLLPSEIYVDDELHKIKWQNASIHPMGNIGSSSDSSQQLVTGTIANSNGQTVSMYIYVAKWGYAGIYRETTVDNAEELFDGKHFVYMNPINFYFSQQMAYSPEDYYLVRFNVSILKEQADGTMQAIGFGYNEEGNIVYENESTGQKAGFVKKLFYPENSRLLEYSTSDSDMYIVDSRAHYTIYWETASRNRVINGGLTGVSGCNIFLGNEDMGSFPLSKLREESDNITPISTTYNCEKMNINEVQAVSNDGIFSVEEVYENGNKHIVLSCKYADVSYDYFNGKFTCSHCKKEQTAPLIGNEYMMSCGTPGCKAYGVQMYYKYADNTARCECEGCKIYESIKDSLMQQSGKTTVVMSINNYYPTTGYVKLYENYIHYRQDEIRVRFIWRQDVDTVIRNLKGFILYAYPEVENSAITQFATDLIMSWDENTDAKKEEIINLAIAYMKRENVGTLNYTDNRARADAYKLLAINEQYDISGDTEKLKGGANNSITPTVMVRIGENTVVYKQAFVVRVLFADYTPQIYYSANKEIYTASRESFESNKPTRMFIAIRKDYWDMDADKIAYGDGEEIPYDDIGEVGYKLLHLNSLLTRVTTTGTAITEENGYYMIEVTNISWEVVDGSAISTQFTINGTVYNSNLLRVKFTR